MNSAEENKKIRKELEVLTTETIALSAIYWTLQEHISEDQKNKIKLEARKFITSNFAKEEIDSFFKRNSDHLFRTILESDVLKSTKSKETK